MINGIGLAYYGIKALKFDDEWEEYDTTKWFCLVWLPIIPIGSFRIRRKRRKDIISKIARQGMWVETIFVIEKRPIDWRQIGKIYLCAHSWWGVLLLLSLFNL